MIKERQYRHACSAGGLTVITVALFLAIRTNYVCVTHVPRIVILLAIDLYPPLSIFYIVNGVDKTQKLTALVTVYAVSNC